MNEHTKTIRIDSARGLVYGDGSAIPAEALANFIALAECQLQIAQGTAHLDQWLKSFQRIDKLPRPGDVTWLPA